MKLKISFKYHNNHHQLVLNDDRMMPWFISRNEMNHNKYYIQCMQSGPHQFNSYNTCEEAKYALINYFIAFLEECYQVKFEG